jgi:hypothetical protein
MQTTYISPVAASASGAAPASGARTITMGRNRLNSIENWVKPPKPSKSRESRARLAERAAAELHAAANTQAGTAPRTDTMINTSIAPDAYPAPRPVSQFVRTVTLAAHR